MASYDDTLHEIAAAAHAAGLLSGSGQVDIGQAESALLHALRRMSQTIDIDTLKVMADPLLVTVEGEHTYALPANFGRLTMPDDETDSGIFVYDVETNSNPTALRYMDPNDMMARRDAAAQRPSHFAVLSSKRLRLFPTPDAGPNSEHYYVSMVYIVEISAESFLSDTDLSVPDHTYFRDATLAQMATELGHPRAPELWALATDSGARLLNQHLRVAQRFQYKHARYSRSGMGGRH